MENMKGIKYLHYASMYCIMQQKIIITVENTYENDCKNV
ncbi:aspartokinase [Paeniclostridium ghonii]|uniref:Aspartokinase n=1 Tax=Paraclostridium ghonii TaxID=29358 RepID=A0ABU0N353_9FIRM|nr:aspartokinase [Paeniclostridium ghonii]